MYCTAVAKSTGRQCRCRALPGSEYCRHHHPSLSGVLTASALREQDLRTKFAERNELQQDIVDEYTGKTHFSLQGLELDHTHELHSIAALCSNLEYIRYRHSVRICEVKRKVKVLINAETNLNWTTQTLNQMKFNAVYAFTGDYILQREQLSGHSITDYLRRSGINSRETTRRIRDRMLLSYDYITQHLQEEIEWEAQLSDALHKMVVDSMCKS